MHHARIIKEQPSPRAEQARDMLLEQEARLLAVIEDDAFQFTTTRARQLLRRVRWWLAEPMIELANGDMGSNGYGNSIDDVCREAAWHRANPPKGRLMRQAISNASVGEG